MRYAIIENNRVINTAKSDEPLADNWVQSDTAKIGDTYDSGTFTTPEPENPVPESIPALNGMLAIDNAGMASEFKAWVDSNDRTFAEKAYFAKATEWRRSSPIIAAGASALGLTESQTDDLFRAAAQLKP